MKKRAFFPAAELKRLAQLAKSEGVTVEIERDGTTVRVMPFSPSEFVSPSVERATVVARQGENSLAAWRARSDHKGSGGYPIPTSADDPLKKWYDGLGFDPKTMGEPDMMRLVAEAEAKWKASIPSKAMIKSERSVLKQLLEHGSGVQVHWRDIKGCGPGTSERLEARGFIEVRMQKEHPDRLEGYILTEAGKDAAVKIIGEG